MDTTDMLSCAVLRQSEIAAALAEPAKPGKRLLESVRVLTAARGMPLNVLEDCAVVSPPEIHQTEHDLWYCLEGEVTFTCGGVLVDPMPVLLPTGATNPNEFKGSRIDGGTTVVLRAGDWLFIPASEPHAHAAADDARLVIVKIPLH